MKRVSLLFLLGMCMVPVAAIRARQSESLTPAVERQLSSIEKTIVDAADAMPEDRFYFSPESLRIQGSELTGVRTFAAQVKHLATDNYDMWSVLTGEPVPQGIVGVEGPPEIKSKSEVMEYLRGSFAMGHRAIASLTTRNAMDLLPFRGSKLPRLDLAFWALTHSNDHYGQIVMYLRTAGIVPPASRPR